MSLGHFILHRIKRQADTKAVLNLKEDECSKSGEISELAAELKRTYLGRINREHGRFASANGPGGLARLLEKHLEGELSFTQLSHQVMTLMKTFIDEKEVEIDTHTLFFIEKSFDSQVFYLFFAANKSAFTIDGSLELKPSYSLDLGPSLFGVKVDLTEWRKEKNYAYLSLIAPRGNRPLANLFYELTDFGNGIDKAEETRAFLEGVEAYADQIADDQVDNYRSQVVDHCLAQDEQDSGVNIEELSQAVDNVDSDDFVKFMVDNYPGSESQVMMDRRGLRRYVKFAGREKDLAISFSSHQLNNRVQYDSENDTLSISGLPRALRSQLLEHIKGRK
ncbi:MAG: nucleoid-associated protein [Candidatus Sedimenticola sp. (ex Thyasira tokunagai)]